MMTKLLTVAILAGFLAGCGTLIPKRVELGQDKVEGFPKKDKVLVERERQAADFLYRAPEDPDQNDVAKALTTSLGVPKEPWPVAGKYLANSLSYRNWVYQTAVAKFAKQNDANEGKKIEGTGWLQIPYFVWLLMVAGMAVIGLIVLAVAWTFIKMYAMSNPPVALGLNAVQAGGRVLSKAVSQIIKGGQRFKKSLEDQTTDEGLKHDIREAFREAQDREQDEEVRALIRNLKGK